MKNKINTIIFLPGWGFNASIGIQLNLEQYNRPYHLLELPKITNPNSPANKQLLTLSKKLAPAIPENSLLIGWSLGGLIAMYFAHLFPHKNLKLVTLNASPKFIAQAEWPGISTQQIHTFYQTAQININRLMQKFIQLICHPVTTKNMLNLLNTHLVSIDNTQHLLCYLNLLITADIRAIYSNMTANCLHLLSEHDHIVPIATANALSTLNSSVNIQIIKHSNHCPFIIEHHRCTELICKFLDNET